MQLLFLLKNPLPSWLLLSSSLYFFCKANSASSCAIRPWDSCLPSSWFSWISIRHFAINFFPVWLQRKEPSITKWIENLQSSSSITITDKKEMQFLHVTIQGTLCLNIIVIAESLPIVTTCCSNGSWSSVAVPQSGRQVLLLKIWTSILYFFGTNIWISSMHNLACANS